MQPDLFVVPAAQATNDWRTYRDLRLAVEIVSPGSRRMDRVEKRRLYQAQGVGSYWIVDPEARLVEVWGPWRRPPRGGDRRAVLASLPRVCGVPAGGGVVVRGDAGVGLGSAVRRFGGSAARRLGGSAARRLGGSSRAFLSEGAQRPRARG
ncbi:MAG: Uma2 family endonuclease [Gemmatimonadetes bacterium]|nr:Uma2 family endonuclease [Gemmatimonadota bacterium]